MPVRRVSGACCVPSASRARSPGCGPCDGDGRAEACSASARRRPRRRPAAPAATPTPTAQTDSQQVPAGELAVGLTEQNPNFVWPPASHEVPAEFERWRDDVGEAQARVLPARARLAGDRAGATASRCSTASHVGCLRDKQPCARLPAACATSSRRWPRARSEGGWETLVVMSGTPEWAARPAGRMRARRTRRRARARRARHGDLHALRRARARRGARSRARS